ncbi:MAG: GNAT family N-acetyltransferase [Treponema sp.]|nr:GNAT family N-acetyltransferase [Treponema sp.]
MLAVKIHEYPAEKLQNFLKKHEKNCVQLCSSVKHNENNLYVLLEDEKSEEPWGVISTEHSIYHCLPNLKSANPEFEKCFNSLIGKKINSVVGEKEVSKIIVGILEKKKFKPYCTNEYFLMTKEDDSALPPPASLLSMGEEIVSCNNTHAEDLFDLQFHYLKEEVIPPGRKISDFYVRSNIKSLLKNQKVFVIESDGKFVSKVNTNAIGWDWVQIGGVYTDQLYRRNGYSYCLLSTLCRRINKQGRKCVLFVKKKNTPAQNLYEKMNFKKSGEYQITYFE